MVLLLHIAIALASIITSGATLMRPTRALLRIAYAFIAATLTSGTYLAILNPSHLPSACVSGLLYLAVAGTMTAIAWRELAAQRVH